MDERPIAVFDSGIGGLTVVAELRQKLPAEHIVYFGDTARVPYGTKSDETVKRFTQQICHFLLRLNPKCIVAACNTVSAVALPELVGRYGVPVVGVVEPGARAAAAAAPVGGLVAVVATEATVASNAYRSAIRKADPGLAVVQKACPLFVPLVEEGRGECDRIVELAVADYLGSVRQLVPDVLVLGCTHYPMLRPTFARYFPGGMTIIDSAEETAISVEELLHRDGSLSRVDRAGKLLCYVSDNPMRFETIGSRFLGHAVPHVVRVDLDELAGTPAPAIHTAQRATA